MMHSVLIVGAGPVGLVMAAELARHRVRCRIIDTLNEPLPYCRALSITARTLEVFEDMGILRNAVDAGIWISGRRVAYAGGPAQDYTEELGDFPYSHSYLNIPQPVIERILTQHLQSLGILVERGLTLKALTQDDEAVSVLLESKDGKTQETQFPYVIGCDGAHSFVRKAAGIAFEGEMMPFEFMLGDVHIDWALPQGYSFQSIHPAIKAAPDFFVAVPLPEPSRYRVSMLAPASDKPTQEGNDHGIQSERPAPGLDLFQTKADELVGEPVRLSDLRWSSIFRISMRLASSYHATNVFLAGDAAHIQPPTGGQGMNTGIQDAYNLAWKLALVLKGRSPKSLLESYTIERREEGEKVIERSLRASMNTGPAGFKNDRLADTQLLISYRTSPWVNPLVNEGWRSDLRPGDRAPDCPGLRRQGIGYPFRLYYLLKGTAHVLLIDVRDPTQHCLDKLRFLAQSLGTEFGEEIGLYLRIVAITSKPQVMDIHPVSDIAWVYDPEGSFANTYSSQDEASWLIRPDGHISWCGVGFNSKSLLSYLHKLFVANIE
ncbi:FAD-dependent monooxygenase [Dyadobacter alkalitolerans]|uniref:FAD-dependent monooxygenase n=1 Tax=Dyadobacter alkalitolerans TaxID=492736 RepID=UPI000555577E|nr:FAD-dependent monooxygenase [Dyadobacter alkalitolerans]